MDQHDSNGKAYRSSIIIVIKYESVVSYPLKGGVLFLRSFLGNDL